MKTVVIAIVFAQCAALALGVKWTPQNDPSTWDPSFSFEYKFDKLPISGQSPREPWSDTYWPSYQGGIANRWQDVENGRQGFNYKLYTLEELNNGSVDLNILSPAEKFDIFNSRYDYPLLNSEWQRCNANDAGWEGLCHGWAPAAIHYIQPDNVTLENKDGLQIPFGSSDVKALLTYFLAQYAAEQEKTSFIAERCNIDINKYPRMANYPDCWDINPGTFHVMLTNLIGIAGTAFVCDVDRSIQVWNQPMTKYNYTLGEATEPSNSSANGTVKQQPVSLTMYYGKETLPTFSAHASLILNKTYNYQLDLDADGNILGGSYEADQWDRVDFMWAADAPAFFGYFQELDAIYKASIKYSGETVVSLRRPHVRLADYRPAHVTTGRVSLSSYDARTRRSWLAAARSEPLRLHFTSFSTRRYTDFVRVFEVEGDRVGAPITVLHGTSMPDDIVVRPGVSVLITFSVDKFAAHTTSDAVGTGFELFVL